MAKSNNIFQKVLFGSIFSTHVPVHMDELLKDGRRIKRKAANALVPLSANKKKREGDDNDSSSPGFNFVSAILDNYTNSDHVYVPDSTKVINVADLMTIAAVKARRRYLTSDQPLLEWRAHADDYLAEMIRNESRGDSDVETCCVCQREGEEHTPLFRCMECFAEDLVCEECCKSKHEDKPLDIVERWNGKFFERISLRDIGVTIQLGHQLGQLCINPRVVRDFTVIHTNGIHTVDLSYCNCPNRASAEKLTDNTGVKNIKDCYKAFSYMMKEWRHLKMAKQAGQGNNGTRTLAETSAGEMGVACIACPRPGVNLPENWKEVAASRRYLYWIYFALDACFRLKRRLVSSEKQDPDLDVGGSYFMEDTLFRQYLSSVTDQQEMSTCTGLSALDHANTKFS
ncbi:hypothetical protein C8R42DRAFT_644500 [Lentinula raphanica]|nr:hypothetical protein C8R42DRAFT_644500 [Lentinula raphanica]